MPREHLHVAQAAAGAVDVAGGHRDEAAPAGMRRAALVAQLLEESDEPIHDAVRLQVGAAIGADHWPDRLGGARQSFQRAAQVGMHGNPPSAALLCNDVANMDRAGDAALRVGHHGPIEAGDLAGAQAGFDREQDHRAVAGRERGMRDAAQHALQHGGRDDLGLFAGHWNGLLSLMGVMERAPSMARRRGSRSVYWEGLPLAGTVPSRGWLELGWRSLRVVQPK